MITKLLPGSRHRNRRPQALPYLFNNEEVFPRNPVRDLDEPLVTCITGVQVGRLAIHDGVLR